MSTVDDSQVIIRMPDIRACSMCSRGTRKWFEQHGFDWADFLRNGITADKFVATGDSMALKVVEVARGRK